MSDVAGVIGALGKGLSSGSRRYGDLKEIERRAQEDADRLKLSLETLELSRKRLQFNKEVELEDQAYRQRQAQAALLKNALDREVDAVGAQRDKQDERTLLAIKHTYNKELQTMRNAGKSSAYKPPPDPNIRVARDLRIQKDLSTMVGKIIGTEQEREYGEYVGAGGRLDESGFPTVNPAKVGKSFFGGGGTINPAIKAGDEFRFWQQSNPAARDSARVLGGLEKYFQTGDPADMVGAIPPATVNPPSAVTPSDTVSAVTRPVRLTKVEAAAVIEVREYMKTLAPGERFDWAGSQKANPQLNWRAIQKAVKAGKVDR